jgi:hypothetical protein
MWVVQWRRKKLDWRQGTYLFYSDGSWIHSVTAGCYRFIYNVTIRFCILDIQLCVGCCGSEWFVICETTDNDCWLITELILLKIDKGLTKTPENFWSNIAYSCSCLSSINNGLTSSVKIIGITCQNLSLQDGWIVLKNGFGDIDKWRSLDFSGSELSGVRPPSDIYLEFCYMSHWSNILPATYMWVVMVWARS